MQRYYEFVQDKERPDICIGTDYYHTTEELNGLFVKVFQGAGYVVAVSKPFEYAILPQKHYKQDSRVFSIMVEVNRFVYMNESSGRLKSVFAMVAGKSHHYMYKSKCKLS